MRAVVYDEHGGSDVLHLAEVSDPHPGAGQVRIKVTAASVNPIDWKLRSDGEPLAQPVVPGVDASGVVDELGEGVTDVSVGDQVFGVGTGTTAEYAVLDGWARVPDGHIGLIDAAGLGLAVETAARALALLDLTRDNLVVLDGAAGGVGTAAVQLAVERGLRIVGTASPDNHDYLRELGAVATTYGPGLADRVRELDVGQVAGAVDLGGKGVIPDLIDLTGDPALVVTIADFSGQHERVQVTGGPGSERAYSALDEAARLIERGRFRMDVSRVFSWERLAEAHDLSEAGHVRGKVVVTVEG